MAFPLDLRSGPKLRHISVEKISPNPYQPRRLFDDEALAELAESIGRYGVITPLTVRRGEEGRYFLIAGERRLRASRMAGLETVPCYILEADDGAASAMALVENLQRRDLDPFEEAEGLLRLTRDFGLTQQQAAAKVGKTQAAVANKLRLLRLKPETVLIIRENGLTERHGRALLAIEDEAEQAAAARYIAEYGLNVAQSEEFISRLKEELSAAREGAEAGPSEVLEAPKRAVRRVLIRDVRLFLNSIDKAVGTMREAGFDAKCRRTEQDGEVVVEIRIPTAGR